MGCSQSKSSSAATAMATATATTTTTKPAAAAVTMTTTTSTTAPPPPSVSSADGLTATIATNRMHVTSNVANSPPTKSADANAIGNSYRNNERLGTDGRNNDNDNDDDDDRIIDNGNGIRANGQKDNSNDRNSDRDPDQAAQKLHALLISAVRSMGTHSTQPVADIDSQRNKGRHGDENGNKHGNGMTKSNQVEEKVGKYGVDRNLWETVVRLCHSFPPAASFVDPDTGATALHLACVALDCVSGSDGVTAAVGGDGGGDNENNGGGDGDGGGGGDKDEHWTTAVDAVRSLVVAHPESVSAKDRGGYLPLHYAIVPTTVSQKTALASRRPGNIVNKEKDSDLDGVGDYTIEKEEAQERWAVRAEVVQLLAASNSNSAESYLCRNDIVYGSEPLIQFLLSKIPDRPPDKASPSASAASALGPCSPLYAALHSLPDDFYVSADDPSPAGPTVFHALSVHGPYPRMADVTNASDGDSPLALLYRRFGRQFDRSEKFFPGDNSRLEVVEWRQRYKCAATNTWRIILALLRGASEEGRAGSRDDAEGAKAKIKENMEASPFSCSDRSAEKSRKLKGVGGGGDGDSGVSSDAASDDDDDDDPPHKLASDLTVHAAASTACPPDLFRYIVETNLDRIRERDARGRLPLHVAAIVAGARGASGGASGRRYSSSVRRRAAGEGRAMSPTTSLLLSSSSSSSPPSLSSLPPPFPAYHSKFVIDELLYSYPDAAAIPVSCPGSAHHGKLPLHLAIESGASWIGGGVKSLYDAYPQAADGMDLTRYPAIRKGIENASTHDAADRQSEAGEDENEDNGDGDGDGDDDDDERRHDGGESSVEKEEHHDAVMLVQRRDAPLSDVVSAMWANEGDGAVQLLGCMSVARFAEEATSSSSSSSSSSSALRSESAGAPNSDALASVALLSLPALVNAMKNHPNEPAIQESACGALRTLAPADGRREISLAASGAFANAVAAMQAHVSDARVQSSACAALSAAVRLGGGGSARAADRATVVASVSGMTAVLNAMGAHANDRDVQAEACSALEALTAHGRGRKGSGGGGDGDDGAPGGADLPELWSEQAGPLLQAAVTHFPEECWTNAGKVLQRLS